MEHLWSQAGATSRKCEGLENGSNKPIGNSWQPTATVLERMVKSMFATACHRLPTIPYLLERGSLHGSAKRNESREPEGPQDSKWTLTLEFGNVG